MRLNLSRQTRPLLAGCIRIDAVADAVAAQDVRWAILMADASGAPGVYIDLNKSANHRVLRNAVLAVIADTGRSDELCALLHLLMDTTPLPDDAEIPAPPARL